MEPERAVVATDGSCLTNPGPGGWAWACEDGRHGSGGHAGTTNNLMELRAVFEMLGAFPPATPLLIQADSMYVINIFTKWLPGWRARGWLTAAKKPVLNREAIELIAERLAGRDVRWEHVLAIFNACAKMKIAECGLRLCPAIVSVSSVMFAKSTLS